MEYPPPPILPPPKPKYQAYIAIVTTATLVVAIYIAITLAGMKQSMAGLQRSAANHEEKGPGSGAKSSELAKIPAGTK